MNVNCQYCRNSFNLGRDYIGQAVAEADEKRQKYIPVECPKCRKTNKVSIKQIRRYVPKPAESDEAE